MDAQTTIADTAAVVALVQSLARLELAEGFVSDDALVSPEVLDENRFLAARDGVDAQLIEPAAEGRVPIRELVPRILDAARPHAQDLGCTDELDHVRVMLENPGPTRQLEIARRPERLPGLVREMAEAFALSPFS